MKPRVIFFTKIGDYIFAGMQVKVGQTGGRKFIISGMNGASDANPICLKPDGNDEYTIQLSRGKELSSTLVPIVKPDSGRS